MVNEAREAIVAFVEGREYSNQHFIVQVPAPTHMLLRIDDGRTHPDIVLFYDDKNGLGLYRSNMCAHQDLRQELIDALHPYIGSPPDELDDEVFATWGGPLTWLALKAALTTGVEP